VVLLVVPWWVTGPAVSHAVSEEGLVVAAVAPSARDPPGFPCQFFPWWRAMQLAMSADPVLRCAGSDQLDSVDGFGSKTVKNLLCKLCPHGRPGNSASCRSRNVEPAN
jgi:hypothetical protein